MKKILFSVMMAVLSATAVMALPRTQSQLNAAAWQAIKGQCLSRGMTPGQVPLTVLRQTSELQVLGSMEGGFAVVATDDALPAVLGVSLSHYSDGTNPNFEWWLQATNAAASEIAASGAPMLVTKPDPAKYPNEVAPLVTTKWDQDEPYNGLCPVFNGSVRCLTGCVATALAQILNYHRTPQHGRGTRTIYYPHNNMNGEAVTADFETDFYDWDNMIDIYQNGHYTQQQADAVALLMRDVGVAVNMEYGGPNEGSGAYSNQAADGMRRYFGFDNAQCLDRNYYSEPQWMDIIYREPSKTKAWPPLWKLAPP